MLVVDQLGHHLRDGNIVDMGGSCCHISGLLTVTNIPLNTTPRIGVGVFASAILESGSISSLAHVQVSTGLGPGIQFVLRPLDSQVTITAVPVPEPTTPGLAVGLGLAALARFRRSGRRAG